MTDVATFGPTPVPCNVVAIAPKKHRNFRIEDEVWFALARIAELRGERTSEVMRQLAKAYVARHRKLIANDPVWHERLRELRAQQESESEAG
jgi:hypothetical protein